VGLPAFSGSCGRTNLRIRISKKPLVVAFNSQ
jgi:hypothetical protein